MNKITIDRDKLYKILDFICNSEHCYRRCPAFEICNRTGKCRESLKAYVIGETNDKTDLVHEPVKNTSRNTIFK